MTSDLKNAAPERYWRQDIEGLRGISILLVVLFHVKAPFFPGGYIGVDVFFVISGYLITGILLREAELTGTLNMPRFFARRARRLLPAAAVMLAGVLAFAFAFYAPLSQTDVSRTALATALYASNLYFGRGATDYLATEAESNPLLHTWSLSVEEQFYLAWPFLLLLFLFGIRAFRQGQGKIVHASRARLKWGTAGLILLSFLLMQALMATGRAHWAFFFSPARAWEFGLGALATLMPPRSRRAAPPPGLLLASGWAGLAGLLAAGVLYTKATAFPGWAALLPGISTVLILRAGTRAETTPRLLTWGPLRAVGKVSYSWYLWHWPVLVFAVGLYGDLELGTRLILGAFSLLPAVLSYHWIENPVRHYPGLNRPAFGLWMLAGLTLFSAVSALGVEKFATWASQRPEQARYTAARADIPDLYARGCHVDYPDLRPAGCGDGPVEAKTQVVLFGDSHAAQWAPALQSVARLRGWRVTYLTKSACPAIDRAPFNVTLRRKYPECDQWRMSVIDTLRVLRPDLVILASYDAYTDLSPKDWRSESAAMFDAITPLVGGIVVLEDSPRPWSDGPACLSRMAWQRNFPGIFSLGRSCDFPLPEKTPMSQAIASAARGYPKVWILDLSGRICPKGICKAETNGIVLYRDAHHLTASYVASLSKTLGEALDGRLTEIAKKSEDMP